MDEQLIVFNFVPQMSTEHTTLPQGGSGDEYMRLYRLGNEYYRQGNWKQAIQHYMEACEIKAEGPAREKLKMAYEILEFYNKDVFGQ